MDRPIYIIVRRSNPGHLHMIQRSLENNTSKMEIVGGEEGIDVMEHVVVRKVG
jgi:hypothetical protein